MPDRCTVYGCSKTANPDSGIGLHKILFFGDEHPDALEEERNGSTLCFTDGPIGNL